MLFLPSSSAFGNPEAITLKEQQPCAASFTFTLTTDKLTSVSGHFSQSFTGFNITDSMMSARPQSIKDFFGLTKSSGCNPQTMLYIQSGITPANFDLCSTIAGKKSLFG